MVSQFFRPQTRHNSVEECPELPRGEPLVGVLEDLGCRLPRQEVRELLDSGSGFISITSGRVRFFDVEIKCLHPGEHVDVEDHGAAKA